MQATRYNLHRRSRTVLLALDEAERSRVAERLSALAEIPPPEWPADLARRLPGGPSDYLVSIDDSLRAFVDVPEGQPMMVQDIVRQEALDYMAEAATRNGH
jgi:hypothetical protein